MKYLIVFLISVLPLIAIAQEKATIVISFKLIAGDNGNLSTELDELYSGGLEEAVHDANTILGDMRSGLIIKYGMNIIGGAGTLPTTKYSLMLTADKNDLEADALANISEFKWRSDSINVFITGIIPDTLGDGCAHFPGAGQTVVLGSHIGGRGDAIIHELGHHFGLYHTHRGDTKLDSIPTGFDYMEYTLDDEIGMTRNELSLYHYGDSYENLLGDDKDSVDVTYQNIMSYHGPDTDPFIRLFVDEQVLIFFSTASNSLYPERDQVLNGNLTHLQFSTGATTCSTGPIGTYCNPYRDVEDALNQVGFLSDIGEELQVLMIEPGLYDDGVRPLIINKPMFLVASHKDGSGNINSHVTIR